MPYLLRTIRTARWTVAEEAQNNLPWLAPGDLIADPIADFTTKEGKLSLFHVEDDRSNFDRVVAALAANRDRVENFDYALIDWRHLEGAGYKRIHTDGETPDAQVNKWHFDLVELSVQRVADLTRIFFNHRENFDRITRKRVKQLIEDHLEFLSVDKLKDRLKQDLDL